MSKYSTELALFFQVKSLANLLVLESQLKEIGELEILKTQNWQVENNCRNDMELLKKTAQAIENNSVVCLQNAFREFDESDDVERYKVVLDYFNSAPASVEKDKALALAKKISVRVKHLMNELRKWKELF